MRRVHVYADEAGNFDFSRATGASKYFILTTVTLADHKMESELLQLRRDLAWSVVDLPPAFHATSDKQAIRDQVFSILTQHDFRVDATILEKAKAQPQTRSSNLVLYQYAWYYHMKYLAPRLVAKGDELMVVAASIETKKKQHVFNNVIQDAMTQSSNNNIVTVSRPADTDPCLQVADYCSWAIQRKWEANDDRSFNLIKDKVKSEFDVWRRGAKLYY